MSMLGPVVVVTETSAPELVDILGKAGAFPVVESTLSATQAAIAEIKPVALLLAEPLADANAGDVQALVRKAQARRGPIMPVLMDAADAAAATVPFAVPFVANEPAHQIVARLRAALRVRTLHATVLRRSRETQNLKTGALPADLLDHATVLCFGRGRSYPTLTTAIAERVGLIGAMSVETAARCLKSRDVDGIVIGDGHNPRIVEALLTVLAEDPSFRNLPVGIFGSSIPRDERLSNFFHVENDLSLLIAWLLPLVRMHAFTGQLNRSLRSIETKGALDSETGLAACSTFWSELDRAIHEAEDGGCALSVARFSFEDIDHRGSIDAARLFSRFVRNEIGRAHV
jgi:hypothetical protein